MGQEEATVVASEEKRALSREVGTLHGAAQAAPAVPNPPFLCWVVVVVCVRACVCVRVCACVCACVCVVQLASECEARVEAVRELDKERASMRVAKAQVASQIAQLQSERDSLSRRLQVLQETLEDERVDRLNASSSQVGCTLVLLGQGVGPVSNARHVCHAQVQLLQAATAAKEAQIEDLKAVDKKIIEEVRMYL